MLEHMCANVKPLGQALASPPEVLNIEDKQASTGLISNLKVNGTSHHN